MSIRLHQLLTHWYPQRDTAEWVLGTIIATERSAYRKAGAMMLFNDLGQRFGMLSGGCLEGQLAAEARKVLARKAAVVVDYDLSVDEEDADNWQHSIGCGGAVHILLQPLNRENEFLGLAEVFEGMERSESSLYRQRIDSIGLDSNHWCVTPIQGHFRRNSCRQVDTAEGRFIETVLAPAPRLLIFGGGMDAIPLANLAHDIGWHISVVDERSGYAKASDFPHAHCIQQALDTVTESAQRPDAIVIMTHNLRLDAAALKFAQRSQAKYVGILGPEHRRLQVEKIAQLSASDFSQLYRGPVGLEIGAKLPETIALAILAECHQVVEGDRQSVGLADQSETKESTA